jgi:hypothetical protein
VSNLVVSEVEDGGVIKLGVDIGPNDTLIGEYRHDPSGVTLVRGCRAGRLNSPEGLWLEFPRGANQPFSGDDLAEMDREKRLVVRAFAKDAENRNLEVLSNWIFIMDTPTMFVDAWSERMMREIFHVRATYMDLTIFVLGK